MLRECAGPQNLPLGIPNWSGRHQEQCVGSEPSVTHSSESEPKEPPELVDRGEHSSAMHREALKSRFISDINNDCLFLLCILQSLLRELTRDFLQTERRRAEREAKTKHDKFLK